MYIGMSLQNDSLQHGYIYITEFKDVSQNVVSKQVYRKMII